MRCTPESENTGWLSSPTLRAYVACRNVPRIKIKSSLKYEVQTPNRQVTRKVTQPFPTHACRINTLYGLLG